MSELIRVPSVVMSERAFGRAQSEGILDIQPNRDHMLAVGQLTETGTDFLPDITVLRDHGSIGNWDENFKDVAPGRPYFPSSELSLQERNLQVVSAGNLRAHTYETGKKLIELTVRDWDALGVALVEGIEVAKNETEGNPDQGPTLVANAVGWALSSLLRQPNLDSPQRKRIAQARSLQPYTVKRT